MSQLERVYKLDRMLRRKNPPTRQEILTEFEISPAQFKRDLDFMRDRLGAPITFDRRTNGYCYASGDFNLPGLWFTEAEVYAMLLAQTLIDQLQPGLVREQLAPFEAKLKTLLGKSVTGSESILARMQVTAIPQRPVNPAIFQTVCDATLRRRKVLMRYFSRSTGVEGDRTISPQRVIYYRGNWYIDAWCHDKQAPRRFSVDAVREASVLDEQAIELPETEQQGYGIFAGPAENTAVLMFDPEAARWISGEEWHPRQRVAQLADGSVRMEVPYSLPHEILMDILRHGAHVEVIEPESLRSAVAEAHRQAAERYGPAKRSVASAQTRREKRIPRPLARQS